MTYRIVATALISVLTACSDRTQTANSNDSTSPADTIERTTESIHVAAVEHTERGATDKKRDAGRKPAEVLEFFGITQGMDVLDMFSGGGYYTEVLSRVVGSEGSVIAHTNQAYAGFVGEEATIRYANNRLPNVEILMAENNAFKFPDGAFDAVLMILAYHDIYYVSPNDGWPKIDGPKLLDEIFISLRPLILPWRSPPMTVYIRQRFLVLKPSLRLRWLRLPVPWPRRLAVTASPRKILVAVLSRCLT